MRAAWPALVEGDIEGRAGRAVRALVTSGCTAIRTHVEATAEAGLRPVEALLSVQAELGHLCRFEIAALSHPLTGPDGAATRNVLNTALDAGVDVVGGAPHLEEDPAAALRWVLDVAAERGLPVDLHLGEVLDPAADHLPLLAREVDARGLGGRVTASHCVSHGLFRPDYQREIGRMLAGAGVAVVSLPRTNLFLQARGTEQAPPRGRRRRRRRQPRGPFRPGGAGRPPRGGGPPRTRRPCRGHEAFDAVSAAVRQVMGLEPVGLRVGDPAELVAIRAGSLREAVAARTSDRIVVHEGRVVARRSVGVWTA